VIAIEIFEDGTVASLMAAPGETLKVGAPMAEIATATQEPAPPSPAEAPAQPPPPPLPGRRVTTMERPEGTAPMRVRTTPAARRRAATLGIPLERLRGTGVDGAICLADLAEAKPHGSVLTRRPCARRSLRRWAVRNGRSRITASARRSIWAKRSIISPP
jgi:pyruvate dehydrogenase E2 component (dihydrolipoamide acetyltransferase)